MQLAAIALPLAAGACAGPWLSAQRAPLLVAAPSSLARAGALRMVTRQEAEAMGRTELLETLSSTTETRDWSELDWLRVYRSAAQRQFLPGFNSVSGLRPTDVSVPELEQRTQMPIEALTPSGSNAQWYLVGAAFFALELCAARLLGLESTLVRALPVAAIAFCVDQLVLGSRLTLLIVTALRPEYADKLARHEAGHFLLAYLCGLPVTAYFLAGRALTIGQAGTVFLDLDLAEQLQRGEIKQSTLARYTTILMGGIAGEALTYRRAEGGWADEQQLVSLLGSLRPPWGPQRVLNLARWSAVQAIELLREHSAVHDELALAMRRGASLGECLDLVGRGIEGAAKQE